MNFTNEQVRKKNRLLNEVDAIKLLQNGEYGILSIAKDNIPYGIPLNYVFNDKDYIYIHCALEGRKIDTLTHNAVVSFCVVGQTEIIPAKFTTNYQSIVVQGKAVLNISDTEKQRALELIINKYSPNDKVIGMKYIEKSFHKAIVVRIEIEQISGKSRSLNPHTKQEIAK